MGIGLFTGCDSSPWVNNPASFPEVITLQFSLDKQGNVWTITEHMDKVFVYQQTTQMWHELNLPSEASPAQAIDISTDNFAWIGTSNGLLQYDIDNEIWREPIQSPRLNGYNIQSILVSETGSIWLDTLTTGVMVSHDDGITWENHFLPNFSVYQLFEDSEHNIWVATGRGLYHYQIEGRNWTRYNISSSDDRHLYALLLTSSNVDDNIESAIPVFSLAEDAQDNLWLASDKGIFTYSRADDEWYFVELSALSAFLFGTIAVDNEGNIWLGTENGTVKFNPVSQEEEYFGRKNGFTDLLITDIVVAQNNQIWFATFGDGIYRYTPN